MSRKSNTSSGSRVSRRVGTKSSVRITCQRQTSGARNRARKSMQGKMRPERFPGARKADKALNDLIAFSLGKTNKVPNSLKKGVESKSKFRMGGVYLPGATEIAIDPGSVNGYTSVYFDTAPSADYIWHRTEECGDPINPM